MLFLNRKEGESIVVAHPDGPITIKINEVKRDGSVWLGIDAPRSVWSIAAKWPNQRHAGRSTETLA